MLRLLTIALLVGCSGARAPSRSPADPQQEFWDHLRGLCGRSFDGVVAVNEGGGDAPDPFEDKLLRMHVRDCSDREIRIPFHVGDDHSRTWVFTRLPAALRLQHDHRHADGSPDAVSMYGGDTVEPGRPDEQRFPADPFSRELFVREGLPGSVTNVWVVTLLPGVRYGYALTRPGREFRVDFDLRQPVTP